MHPSWPEPLLTAAPPRALARSPPPPPAPSPPALSQFSIFRTLARSQKCQEGMKLDTEISTQSDFLPPLRLSPQTLS